MPIEERTHTRSRFSNWTSADVQAHKLQALANANISCNHVHFVNVDFTRDDVFEKLAEAGYDPDKKTLFLWEGVTLYLSEAEVRKNYAERQQPRLQEQYPAG